MGLFDRFKKKSKNKSTNFEYFAQYIATIYYVLKESNFGKQLNDKQLLFATALCDTIDYIDSGTMTVEEIQESVMYAQIGCVGIFPYRVQHDSLFSKEEHKDLIGLTMQLEALIFASAMIADYHEIVDIIVEMKPLISQTVIQTLEQGRRSSIYSIIYQTVTIYLNDSNFRNAVLSFDI